MTHKLYILFLIVCQQFSVLHHWPCFISHYKPLKSLTVQHVRTNSTFIHLSLAVMLPIIIYMQTARAPSTCLYLLIRAYDVMKVFYSAQHHGSTSHPLSLVLSQKEISQNHENQYNQDDSRGQSFWWWQRAWHSHGVFQSLTHTVNNGNWQLGMLSNALNWS